MEEKKSFYNEATKKAAYKYKAENIKRVPLDMPISDYEALKQFAADHGEKVNQFIKSAIKERIERMTEAGEDTGADQSAS